MPTVLTIGNFDGVHRGHSALVGAARAMADAGSEPGRVVALTFDPAPGAMLAPERALPRIQKVSRRIEDLRHAGADEVVVIEPTLEFLSEEALPFVHRLVEEYGLANGGGWVEGVDFRFGRGRVGDTALLRMLGEQMGFVLRVVDPVEVEMVDGSQITVSSSLVRSFIEKAEMDNVTACLDRVWTLFGPVVHGEKRGRELGVPTANLSPEAWDGLVTPPEGVYAGLTKVNGTLYPAAISVGRKPMFGGTALEIETHLLRYHGGADDLYGQEMSVGFGSFLRPQRTYADVDELKRAIAHDIRVTDRWYGLNAGSLSCALSGIF